MKSHSSSNVAAPALAALLGEPTGSTWLRGHRPQAQSEEEATFAGLAAPTNALRESNRENTQVLYRQAGLRQWAAGSSGLKLFMVVALCAVATSVAMVVS